MPERLSNKENEKKSALSISKPLLTCLLFSEVNNDVFQWVDIALNQTPSFFNLV